MESAIASAVQAIPTVIEGVKTARSVYKRLLEDSYKKKDIEDEEWEVLKKIPRYSAIGREGANQKIARNSANHVAAEMKRYDRRRGYRKRRS